MNATGMAKSSKGYTATWTDGVAEISVTRRTEDEAAHALATAIADHLAVLGEAEAPAMELPPASLTVAEEAIENARARIADAIVANAVASLAQPAPAYDPRLDDEGLVDYARVNEPQILNRTKNPDGTGWTWNKGPRLLKLPGNMT